MKLDDPNESETRDLPMRLEPMMLAHLALTGDVAQQKRWREQLEVIRQTQAIAEEDDPETRALLLGDKAWAQIRTTGLVGALLNGGLGVMWLSMLVPMYAIGHGFGWLASLTLALPLPIAWKVSRRLFERSARKGMRALRRRDGAARRLAVFAANLPRTAVAGFSFGFVLMFLQGLLTWFMTPAPTIGLELWTDFYYAVLAGTITGGASMAMAPLASRPPPK